MAMKDMNKEHKMFIALLFGQLSIAAVFRLITDPELQDKALDMYWIFGLIFMVSCYLLANRFRQGNQRLLEGSPEATTSLYQQLQSKFILRLALMEGSVLVNLVLSFVMHNDYLMFNALGGMMLYVLLKQSPEEKVFFDQFK